MGALTEEMEFTQRIDFPAKAENIALAEKLIDEACTKHNVHESHYGNILIALTEAVNNAIHHGNALDPAKEGDPRLRGERRPDHLPWCRTRALDSTSSTCRTRPTRRTWRSPTDVAFS